MKIQETSPNLERQNLIDAVAEDAAQYLGVNNLENTPNEIIKRVDKTVISLVFEKASGIPQDEEPYLLLGALWGIQMRRQFNWYWANVIIDGEINEVAMISPNQEMILFPFSFIRACINKQCICTVLLAFNMLIAKDNFKKLKQGQYENIMLSIHHIIPPYTLES